MSSFGVGVYLLTIVWLITLMLCWVSTRTGHYVGKFSVAVALLLTIILASLPSGDLNISHSANFFDQLYVLRVVVLTVLLLGVAAGGVYSFFHFCLTPVETFKVGVFGSSKN